ncbi:MAG: NADH-quinone oxidoreductase subunit M [Myxococcota bacterium]|nr:NADH-quinone oxidoreductase subunit M [Myxococcota bacterium]
MSTQDPFVEIASRYPLLSLVIFLPLFGALLAIFVPKDNRKALQAVGLFISTLTLLGAIVIWREFDSIVGFQMVERFEWVPGGIHYFLGIDGLNLLLVMLSTLLTPIVLLSATSAVHSRVKEFVVCVLLLETGTLGCLLALDLFLFYFFCEALLIPLYLLIGIWGGKARSYAAKKFMAYMVFGTSLMLVALVYLYRKTGASSSAYTDILALELTHNEQVWIFLAIAFSFAIKVPLVPFHTWLSDAHTEAPIAGSVFLSGMLLNIGAYAFLRFCIPLFPHAAGVCSKPIMVLAVIGIIYGAFLAFAQTDVKKLVAYASLSQLGFILLGIFVFTEAGVEGSLLQMFSHGITVCGLILCVGILTERRETSTVTAYGGIAKRLPVFTAVLTVMMFSCIGVPGTSGFAGEFLILSGTFQEALHSQLLPLSGWKPSLGLYDNLNGLVAWLSSWRVVTTTLAVLAVLGMVLGVVYMLSMFRRMMCDPITHDDNGQLSDLSLREAIYLLPLVVLIIFVGLCPNVLMEKTHASVDAYVAHVRPELAEARSPVTEKIKRSRRGIAFKDKDLPGRIERSDGVQPAGPASFATPNSGE